MFIAMEYPNRTKNNDDDDDALLSPRQTVEYLRQIWKQPVTVTSFRMLRLRRKDDPEMPEPDFLDGDIYLWKKSTLRKIKPPKQYKKH